MVFKCQEDSFLKEYTSNVISCLPTEFEVVEDGKKKKVKGFEVLCEDTILFPEGGGQPYDQGYLNDKRVHQVLRKGDQAFHYLTDALNPGDVVRQTIDWGRRFDHMQQHSGQHLISAILEKDFGYNTVAWWLGDEVSYVELDTPTVSQEQISELEDKCNDLIRRAISVNVQVFSEDSEDDAIKEAKSRGLPDDHKGDIRVINIEGVDSNMCCGTHVSNLSQLQVVKMLHVDKSKRKNQCLLHFLIGNRVLAKVAQCVQRENKITAILNNGPMQHVELIEKLSKSSRATVKSLQVALRDLAALEAEKLKMANPKPPYFCLHRKDGDGDFVNAFIRAVGSTDTLLCVTTGEDKGAGNVTLYGQDKVISDVGVQICDILEGKGNGKGARFQAKVGNLGNRPKVEQLLSEYFKKSET